MIALPPPFQIRTFFSPANRFTSIGDLFSDIFTILISVGAITSIFFIIMGGIKMITASGDPKQLEGARNTIFYAIIGLSVNALAFVILQVVQYFLKSNIPVT